MKGVSSAVLVLGFSHVGLLSAQTTSLVSVNMNGDASGAACRALHPCISGDNRFIAFESLASDLVVGDTNGVRDAFVRDMQLATTERLSVSTSGDQANGTCEFVSLSLDGRFAAFVSLASNLGGPDAAGVQDVFLRDRLLATTRIVSVSVAGGAANGPSVQVAPPTISADGRFVAFESTASNLVPGDTNGVLDVFARDMTLYSTELISVSISGPANHQSSQAQITSDGRYVAFVSGASDLIFGDMNGNAADVFVRDRWLGITEIVSVSSAGAQGPSSSRAPAISSDGRFVAFSSLNSLAPNDPQSWSDIYVRDRQSGTTTRASVPIPGHPNQYPQCYNPSISADGRFVTFYSLASSLAPGDVNGMPDVFLRDMLLQSSELVSVATSGVQANLDSYFSSVSPDGRFVAFGSHATNLVPNDTSFFEDVYVRDRAAPGSALCAGDGSGSRWPCGVQSPPAHGCPNSTGPGARLVADGWPTLAHDSLALRASGMPDGLCVYLQGTLASQGGAGVVFGQGLWCVAGKVLTLGIRANVGGASSYPGPGEPPISISGMLSPPATRIYQAWYRDGMTFCAFGSFQPSSNLTNAWLTKWVQ